jgi:hypothetical protein
LHFCKLALIVSRYIELSRESMVSTRKQKQAVIEASNPLKDTGILQQVFAFLPGSWLFLGAVCSDWNAVYAAMADKRMPSISLYSNKKLVTFGTHTTLYSAAVASPATARLAWEWGLQLCIQKESLQVIAGLHADVGTMTVLLELGMPLSETFANAVALAGRLNVLQFLLRQQLCPKPWFLCHYAARSGSIVMLKWLNKQSWCTFNELACEGAVLAGQLAALQHLRSEGCDWDADYIARYAASGGSIEVDEWLRQQEGIVIDAGVMSWAVGAGQISMCKHLRSIGCAWDASACTNAAGGGHLDVLRWLRANGCPWVVHDMCISAARSSRTDVLDYLIEQGEVLEAELLTDVLNLAGACNKLLSAQWLRQHDAQWPAVLKYRALQWSGESLAWARAEGCTSPVTL